jgi:hypothetical protein
MSPIFAIRAGNQCLASTFFWFCCCFEHLVAGAWALMLMIDGFSSLSNIRRSWPGIVQCFYKIHLFCDMHLSLVLKG